MYFSTFFIIFASNIRIVTTLNKKNHITIAKALGIILMVTCHAGIPNSHISDFIYIFHMPLFFFCSGYFFKGILQHTDLQLFVSRKITGLYIPYLKYSFTFLLFNYIFFKLHFYNTTYNLNEYINHCLRIVTMTEYEELMLRPFWFLKILLLSSISIALLSYVCSKYRKLFNTKLLLTLSLTTTLLFKFIDFQCPVIGDCSLITLGIVYLYSGFIYRQYEAHFYINKLILFIMFTIVLIGSLYFQGIIDMRYTTIANTVPYYILSILGIIFVLEISTQFNNALPNIIKNSLYYIGNHTMSILALHLLAFKLGSILKILIYDLPINKLSDHTVIFEHNHLFWIIYLTLGITIPLLPYMRLKMFYPWERRNTIY